MVALCVTAPLALAEPGDGSRTNIVDERRAAFGERTERLLELQRSGRIASSRRQALSGDVQTRVYSRYLESFTHAIPDAYIDLDFGE